MDKGYIVRMNPRNFGYIRDSLTSVEYFFHRDDFHGHWTDLQDDISGGIKVIVEFEVVKNSVKGPRANNVRRLDYPNQAV